MITTIVAAIFVFGLLVFVHEFGHFITAKSVGMRVDEFAIGFGPNLVNKQKGETLYSLRAIPLGGFNKIAGMDPDEEQDQRSFYAKPIWARMLVIVAGSAMNLLLPVLLFTVVFLSSGIDKPSDEAVVGRVLADRPAAHAGLMQGDRILSVNSNQITTWREFVGIIQVNSGNTLTIQYNRQGVIGSVAVVPEFDAKNNRGLIGIMPQISSYQPGLFEAVGLAGKQTVSVAGSMIVGIVQMVTGKIAADVAGPIGVAQMAGEVAQMGFIPLLQFAAFLSINLGLINLLPLPVLDGGHIVTLAIEGLRGKPLSKEKLQFVQMIGFALLLMLLIMATYKDVTRLNFL